jgi:hypothetical protein
VVLNEHIIFQKSFLSRGNDLIAVSLIDQVSWGVITGITRENYLVNNPGNSILYSLLYKLV